MLCSAYSLPSEFISVTAAASVGSSARLTLGCSFDAALDASIPSSSDDIPFTSLDSKSADHQSGAREDQEIGDGMLQRMMMMMIVKSGKLI